MNARRVDIKIGVYTDSRSFELRKYYAVLLNGKTKQTFSTNEDAEEYANTLRSFGKQHNQVINSAEGFS